ncbi:MAG: phosphatase PAP2 family protein [Treponema sp.]|nr:phosphatase PAP2 family protein [Treponema sp.]
MNKNSIPVKIILSAALAIMLCVTAGAQSFRGRGDVFALDGLKDGLIFGSGVLLSGGDLLLDNVLEFNRQKYDSSKVYDKDDVNALDRIFMNSYSKKLDRAGDISLVAAMAAPAVLLATDKSEWLTVGVMYAETLLIANGIKELTKLCVTRARPYMYYDPSTYPEDDLEDGDFANSFPSGHSTMAFAGATFASYTFSKYFPDSPYRYAVTGGSYALALATAALRIKSGNHFMTDVLTGAVIGSATGFLVPWLHTFNTKNDLNVGLTGNGVLVRVKW